MNNIKNISAFGIETANIIGFLNNIGNNECDTRLLVKEGDTLVAYELKRDFKPKFKEQYCINNEEQRHAPLVLTGNKIEVIHRKINLLSQFGYWEEVAGENEKRWVSLGKVSEYCLMFHDYSNL